MAGIWTKNGYVEQTPGEYTFPADERKKKEQKERARTIRANQEFNSPAAQLRREQATTRELAGQQSPASILRKGKIKAGERTTGLGEIRAIRREATQAASVAADAPYNREKQLDRELTRYVTDAEARAKVAASRGAGADAAELEADSESDLQESRQLWTTEENIEKHDNLVEIIELQRDAAEGLADDASTARLDELKETASADMDALRFEAAEAEKSVDKTIAMEKYKAILKMTTEIAESATIFPQEVDEYTGEGIGATPEEQVKSRVKAGVEAADAATAGDDVAGTITPAEIIELDKIDAILSNPEKKKGLSRTKRIRLERKMKILDAKV